MKKIIKIGIFIFLLQVSTICIVNASTNTRERSSDDYLVPDTIEVTDQNRSNVLRTPAVDEKEKIYDFAELLTEDEEQKLYTLITEFINKHKLDLAVVTIDHNNKGSAQVYADDFYDYNKFGINSTRDGVLFLIDMQTREIYMTTTGNAIIMYNDNRINDALDAVYSYMTNQSYYEGIEAYIHKIDSFANSGIPSGNKNASLDENGNIRYEEKISLWFIGLMSFTITVIIMVVLVSQNKLVRKNTTAKEYLKKDSVKITSISETIISSHTTSHRISEPSDGGYSGFSGGGGSSTHSGSSGGSHGGGGHGF